MNNQTSWSEQLQRIGMSEFSSAHQDILMIEENNKAVLTELEQ